MIKILALDEYKQSWPIPTTSDTVKQDAQITMFIEDATNQIDNLCSGRVFNEYPNLDQVKDATRIYKLKRAIGDLTLLLDQTGKMFYNSTNNGGGNAPFSLTTQSDNSQVEWKRQDIIRNLIEAGFYSNLRVGGDTTCSTNSRDTTTSEAYDELVKKLSGSFLRLNGSNQYQGDEMVFANTCELSNVGDINGSQVYDPNIQDWRKPLIKGYNIDISGTIDPIVKDLNDKISANTEDIDNLRLKDVEIENNVNTLTTTLNNVETTVNAHDGEIKTIDNDLSSLGNQVLGIQGDVNSLKLVQKQQSKDIITLENEVDILKEFANNGYVIKFMGVWDQDTLYQIGQYVLYNNLTYFCIKENRAIEPTNTEYWYQKTVSQEINLTNYYTKQEIDTKLQNYAELNEDNEFIGDNTFSGTNSFQNGLTVNGRTSLENLSVNTTNVVGTLTNQGTTTLNGETTINNDLYVLQDHSFKLGYYKDTPKLIISGVSGNNDTMIKSGDGSKSIHIRNVVEPNLPDDVATKNYVDTNSVSLNGNNTFTGANTFNRPVSVGTPTSSTHAATKSYVDNKVVKSVAVDFSKFIYENAFNNSGRRTKIYRLNLWDPIFNNVYPANIINVVWFANSDIWMTMNYAVKIGNPSIIRFYFERPDTTSDFTPDGIAKLYYYSN